MDGLRRFPLPRGLALGLLAYVALRAFVLLVTFDEVCIPIFELPGVGMIPTLALEGWKGSSPRLYYDNCGGLISTGFLAVPFYALLGKTYLALKLVPATLGLVALVLLWRYLDRHWSRAAANAGALLFALLPPTLTRFSLIAQGNHFENLPFQLAVLTAFAAAQRRPGSRARLAAFGLASGFAIFTYFGSMAIVAVTALLHLVVRGPRRALGDLASWLPGFVIGLAPLLWVAQADGLPQANVTGMLLAEADSHGSPASRLGEFALERLPRAGTFRDLGPLPAAIGEGLFLVAFLGAWLVLLPGVLRGVARTLRSWGTGSGWLGRRDDACVHEAFAGLRHAPYVLYFPTIVLVITFGNLRFSNYFGPVAVGSSRYFVPHFMYAAMVIGTALPWLLASARRHHRVLGGLLALATLLSAPFALPLPTEDSSGVGARYRGYWMPYYNGVALHHQHFDRGSGRYRWDIDEVRAILADFPPHQREEILFGVGYHLAMALDQSPGYRTAPRLADLVEGFPEDDGPSLARGMGSYLGQRVFVRGKRREEAEEHIDEVSRSDHPLLSHVLEGLCLPSAFPLTCTLEMRFERARKLARFLADGARPDWNTGRGMAFGRLAGREQPADDPILAAQLELPLNARSSAFWRGVGQGIATQAAPGRAAAILSRWVPPPHRAGALGGLGAEMARYRPDEVSPAGWARRHLADEAERAAFVAGWDRTRQRPPGQDG